jgi:hypothetical protein
MRCLLFLAVTSISMAAAAAEYQLPIPSDAKAQYFVLEKGGTKDMPTMVTKRVGTSGTSYSWRVFDCKAGTVKYLGTGDSLEKMRASKPETNMAPLVEGSIAYYQWRHACSK